MLVLVPVPTGVGTDQHTRELSLTHQLRCLARPTPHALLHTRRQQPLSPQPTTYCLSISIVNQHGYGLGEDVLCCSARVDPTGFAFVASSAGAGRSGRHGESASVLRLTLRPSSDRAAAGGIPPRPSFRLPLEVTAYGCTSIYCCRNFRGGG
jgi:hypothetical protein